MRTFYVYVPDANANATNVLRVPVLSGSGPYEPLDGKVPSRKTQRRIDLSRKRREGTGTRTDQRNNVTHDRRTPTTHPKSILTNPNPLFERPQQRNANGYQRSNDYDRRGYGGPKRNDDYTRSRRPHLDNGVYVTDNARNEDGRHEYDERERRNHDERPEWAIYDDAKTDSDSENE